MNIEKEIVKCPKCGKDAMAIMASCECDRMFCNGGRCGANTRIDHYQCSSCNWSNWGSNQTEKTN